MPPAPGLRDSRSLLLSVWASAGFAVLSLGWGLLAGSALIIFDGLYAFASVFLSLLGVLALRTSRKGADERYPWGREVWEPLAIMVKAAALGALCLYAAVGAVGELFQGGRKIAAGSAVTYAVVATVGCAAVSFWLRRRARTGSDLVRAEAAEWLGDTFLSVGTLLGFIVALVLDSTGNARLADYVDPVMVGVISTAFLWVPGRLIARGFREVLSMAPPQPILDQLRSSVGEVEDMYGFTESFLRASKVGNRLDVEIDFVVGTDSAVQTVAACDTVREVLTRRLEPLGYEKWMSINFTADRRWAV